MATFRYLQNKVICFKQRCAKYAADATVKLMEVNW